MLQFKTLISGFIALMLSITPFTALADSHDVLGLGGVTPVGQWEAGNRESRYDVVLCGDGTQLCAKLVWIRPQDVNPNNEKFIDTWVVYEARRSRPAVWRGDFSINGTTYGGKIRIISQNKLMLTGCVFIFCESYELFRLKNPDGSPV